MKTIRIQHRTASLVCAIMLLLQISPVLAAGPPRTEDNRILEVTFTKWITTYPLMAGIVGGDVTGTFAGEVLDRKVSADGLITRLEPIYQVIDSTGRYSFTALIHGGLNNQTGAALLDGVILAGWRTGARVHVEFQAMTNCSGAPTSGTCFQGTIRVLPQND